MYIDDTQLRDYIQREYTLSADDMTALDTYQADHNVSLKEALLHAGHLNEEALQKIIADIRGIPFIDVAREKIEPDVLAHIPEALARRHLIIAFKKDDAGLHVAMVNLDNVTIVHTLKKSLRIPIVQYVTTTSSLQSALVQYRKSLNVEFDELIQKHIKSATAHAPEGDELSPEELKKLAEDVPVIKIVDTLISHAVLQNASDIHIEPEEHDAIVRYRIDGILHDAMTLPKNITPGVTVRIKVLANLRLDEKRLPQDGRFKTEIHDQRISFRVSTLPTYFGEKVVMRILRENAHGMSLDRLGFHGQGLETMNHAMQQKTGLILVSGPTGSGKTTTLYTMLDLLNTPEVNISTVEDPIEYQVERINQTQVRSDIGLTFAEGLRSLLRQDPDILMVGEIRDSETVSLAVNAALTGHLVLSTIHTNSAAGVIPRMIDMGIEPFLITSTIKTVLGQRLIRVLTDTKEEYFLSKKEQQELAEVIDLDHVLEALRRENIVPQDATWDTIPVYRAVPSEASETGYAGRMGIYEVLNVTPEVKQAIVNGANEEDIERAAKNAGMLTMIEDGMFKVVQGITTTEEVLRVISD